MTYSHDLKAKVVKYYHTYSDSYRNISRIFDISKSTVHRWIYEKMTVDKHKDDTIDELIDTYINNNPLTQLKYIKNYLYQEHNIVVSLTTIWRKIRVLGISRKKVYKRKTLTCNTPEIKKEFIAKVNNHKKTIYCLDETSIEVHVHPSYGYTKKGKRCYYDSKTKRNPKKLHGIFMISPENIVNYELHDGPINQEKLISFLSNSKFDGDILMDNCSIHHGKLVKNYLSKEGVDVLYNVAYSPELNPIEEVFGIFKRNLRCRIIDKISDMKKYIDDEVERINEEINLRNFYKHSFGI